MLNIVEVRKIFSHDVNILQLLILIKEKNKTEVLLKMSQKYRCSF